MESTAVQHGPGDDVVVRNLTKCYGQGANALTALDRVSLDIRPGEFISIIGASGCGKTSLLRVMCGLASFDEGDVYIGGSEVVGIPSNIGFAFQDPSLLAWRSVWQNVEVAISSRDNPMSKAERAERVKAQLELMDLINFRDFKPYQLSGGMQQRVGLARALVGSPSVLFLDEPLGALDAFTRMRLQEEVAVLLARQRCTVALVTHDVDEALILADRVVIMSPSPGRIHSIVEIPGGRPRERMGFFEMPDIVKLRSEILAMITGASRAGEAMPMSHR